METETTAGKIHPESPAASMAEDSQQPPLATRLKWPLLAVVGAGLLAMAFAVDTSVEGFLTHLHYSGSVHDLFNVAETFGNGFGVALVLLLVVVLDRHRQAAVLRLTWCAVGAGLMADVVKLMVSRVRPRDTDLVIAHVWDTFGHFVPLASNGSGSQSFPSAHTATAAGLAVGLAILYPRGRYLFAALAVCVAMQRMAVGAHFPSDVLVGGALGAGWAYFCQAGTPLGNWIGRWEDWLALKLHSDDDASQPATLEFPGAAAEPSVAATHESEKRRAA